MEARIRVHKEGVLTLDEVITHRIGDNHLNLTMFDPPLSIHHESDMNGDVLISQESITRSAAAGEIVLLEHQEHTIEIYHKPPTTRFR